MQLVIDIPDEEYRWIRKSDETVFADEASKECMLHAIKNGTPLPKNHGRLGDLDRVKAKVFNASMDEHFMPVNLLTCDDVTDIIDYIPTIIEGK